MTPSHYETLGVESGADAATIRRAYLDLARRLHPDRLIDASEAERGRYAEQMREVNEAWRVLGDPARRRAYDLTRRGVPDDGTRPAPVPHVGDGEVRVGVGRVVRSVPWLLLLGVLALIFVFTAYAGGGGTAASECILVASGPTTTEVPCEQPGARHILTRVASGSPCPPDTERLELFDEPGALCLSVP